MTSINQEIASHILERAETKARELSVNVCIAITDTGGHLYAFQRMDNAFIGSVDVAIKKANTSSMFPLPTADFGTLIRDEHLTGMELSNQGLIGFAGGQPISRDGHLIGAIGISGASAEQDAAIAEYAAGN
jgi:uncharacterized protein GlcG (DUF336 family)